MPKLYFPFTFDANLEALGIDRITDFMPGEDKLVLSRSLFDSLPEGQLAAKNFVANATDTTEKDQRRTWQGPVPRNAEPALFSCCSARKSLGRQDS